MYTKTEVEEMLNHDTYKINSAVNKQEEAIAFWNRSLEHCHLAEIYVQLADFQNAISHMYLALSDIHNAEIRFGKNSKPACIELAERYMAYKTHIVDLRHGRVSQLSIFTQSIQDDPHADSNKENIGMSSMSR